MSVIDVTTPSKDAALGVSLYTATPPTSFHAIADAISTFYEALGRPAKEFTLLLREGKIRRRAFKAQSFAKAVSDDSVRLLYSGDVTDPAGVVVECWLRPLNPEKLAYEPRWITITGCSLAAEDEAVRALLDAFVSNYDIAQGSITKYRSLAYARQECSFSGAVSPSELDRETAARLGEDQMLEGRYVRRLRRLYPITIIGPKIWAELPPLPHVKPLPIIEDLGPCKQMRAWPNLVEPRDAAFLAGTVELRRWLWPYTIQNPADDPNP